MAHGDRAGSMKKPVGSPELSLADLIDRQAPDNSRSHDVGMIAASLERLAQMGLEPKLDR